MKKILWVLAFLLTVSVCFGQVNRGIQTRTVYQPFTIDSGATDTTEVILNLSGYAEQGWPTLLLKVDSTKSFNVWFSSGAAVRYWGLDTSYTTRVQCVFAEELTAKTTFKPLNIAFIQSKALVDTSDRSVGHVPGCDLFRVSIEPTAETGDVIKGVAVLRFK